MEKTMQVENEESLCKISTLVFMDLESTGLPSDIGARNVHITEICLVAVDRSCFIEDRNLRVLNKISLCIRPRTQISHGSKLITGLYDDILESQEEFDDSVPKMLEYFFRRLKKPICLLAHNGNRFDFPVLQAELRRLNYCLGSDILCADTLVAFRSICLSKKQVEADKKAKQEEMAKCSQDVPISEEDIDILLSRDLEYFAEIDAKLTCVDKIISEADKSETFFLENTPSNHMLTHSQNEKTPQRDKLPIDLKHNANFYKKRKILDPTFLPKYQYKKKALPAKRVLFPDAIKEDLKEPVPEIHKIKSFSLSNLYHFFFSKDPPNSHYAEIDCISLSKVCQKINEDFLDWIDKNNIEFSTINALW